MSEYEVVVAMLVRLIKAIRPLGQGPPTVRQAIFSDDQATE